MNCCCARGLVHFLSQSHLDAMKLKIFLLSECEKNRKFILNQVWFETLTVIFGITIGDWDGAG